MTLGNVVTWLPLLLLLLSLVLLCRAHFAGLSHVPVTGNLAIGRTLTASSTCGATGAEEFCSVTDTRDCSTCHSSNSSLAHPPSSMTDRDAARSPTRTWWQSSNNVAPVTLELTLEATFFFTHVVLSFRSPLPAAMVIEKSTDSGKSYQPVQYYSTNCTEDFGLPNTVFPSLSANPTCTSAFSDMDPTANREMVYISSPPPLQLDLNDPDDVNRVTLTNLRVRLLRHIFPPGVDARSVYFAIYNLEVWGWCFCSGHSAGPCQANQQERAIDRMVPSVCSCTNGTTGRQCEMCLPLNNASPWTTGFNTSSTPCQMCVCNGHSDSCQYDSVSMQGVCQECSNGTAGRDCEMCAPGFYRNSSDSSDACEECMCSTAGTLPDTVCAADNSNPSLSAGQCHCKSNVTGDLCDRCRMGTFDLRADNPDGCQPCSCPECDQLVGRCPCSPTDDPNCCPFDQYRVNSSCTDCACHPNSSMANVCSTEGLCSCKPGVGGDKCDQCLPGFYGISEDGCSPCDCNIAGSTDATVCDADTGQCSCRNGLGGRRCDTCPDGTRGPSSLTHTPCVACHCNGYSSVCRSASGWYLASVNDQFNSSSISQLNGWSVEHGSAEVRQTADGSFVLEITPHAQTVFINLPSRYHDDKLTAYSLPMTMVASTPYYSTQATPITVSMEIIGMYSPFRRATVVSKSYPLSQAMSETKMFMNGDNFNEHFIYFIRPASPDTMHRVLSSIISMKLIVKIPTPISGANTTIFMDSAALSYAVNSRTDVMAVSPLQEVTFVEDCTCSFTRMGDHCQRCSNSFTFDPGNGGQFARCVPCNCQESPDVCDPSSGECLNCVIGTNGTHCQECASGYYRHPVSNKCLPCSCPGLPTARNHFAHSCSAEGNGSVVCDCSAGYEGDDCSVCAAGFFGDPLLASSGCRQCRCSNIGSQMPVCIRSSGQCPCYDMYTGRTCSDCADSFWDPLKNGTCAPCSCHLNGSISSSCDQATGVCQCREGFAGDKCDRCRPSGTTGVFPFCEQCDECSTRFNQPVNTLEVDIVRAESEVNALMNRTEAVDDSILEPVQVLLMRIQDILESRNISVITSDIISTYNQLCDLIDRMRGLLNRLNTLQRQVSNSRNETNSLTSQLNILLTRLDSLSLLLRNLSRQAMLLGPAELTPLMNTLESAEIRSNTSYKLVQENVTRFADGIDQTLVEMNSKYPVFILLRNMTLALLEELQQKIQEYREFIREASNTLCGSSGDCGGECGGVMCEGCGGVQCNGSVAQVLQAANITQQAQETTRQLYEQLMTAISILDRARNISKAANSTSFMAEASARQAVTRSQELLRLIRDLLSRVQNQLALPIPNVTLIGLLQNETLALQLTRTPEQVNATVTDLMTVISMFVDIGNVTEEELRRRAERALNTSRMADEIADDVLRDVTQLRERLQQLQANRTAVESQVVPTRMLIQQARNDTNNAEVSLNATERSLAQLGSRVANLSREVTLLQEHFERNRMRLATIRNVTEQTDQLSNVLQQDSVLQENRLSQLEQTAKSNLAVANRDLADARDIHQRGEELRERASKQLLRVEVLLNRRQCIESEQEQLRGDIQRVAAQLEAVRNDIRVNVARNTICVRAGGIN